jgi:murein DD-endopeptidase MepM/ murein hydrolase activator NlpD
MDPGVTWHRPNDPAGKITSPFGQRVAPYPGASTYHLGVDLRAGTYGVDGSIYAAHDGMVSSRYVTPMGAQVVVIDHGGGLKTYYVHMPADGVYVARGQHVAGGQRIAIAGKTGAATVHLHFETRVNGTAVDPVPFMRARGVDLTVTASPTIEPPPQEQEDHDMALYIKGDKAPDVYAVDTNSGLRRAVDLPEWNVITAAGVKTHTVEQAQLDAITKAPGSR